MPRSLQTTPAKPPAPPPMKPKTDHSLDWISLLVRGRPTGPPPKKYQLAAQRAVSRGLNKGSEPF